MVDTEQKLAEYLAVLRHAKWVAVDTEADSLHAYPEKVCLIQISTTSGDRLIDPLAGLNLAPLLEALAVHELIMHGADYDLRLLSRHHEFIPRRIFDTMLAARLLGLRQFSLGHLVEKYLGIKLEKGAQKANWALRPLSPRMELYARNDTRHLKPLADRLRGELQQAGRLAWHKEFCDRLILDSTRERPPNGDAVWRLKGSHLLDRSGLAVLRELWKWREGEAVRANKPPYFVLSHEALVQMAAAAAEGRALDPFFPRHISERRRAGILKAVAHARQLHPDLHPKVLRPTSRRPSDTERKRYAELQKKRDAQAARLGIDPTVIASRGTLSELAHDWERNRTTLMSWQLELLSS